ncbi:hypothetical protein ACHQM5_017373 [Ranunculus cassubicifolius]
MALSVDSHVVEIPTVTEEEKSLTAIQHHPLMEISQSPGHLLLLKLWQREEDLFSRRISNKETRMDKIRCEIFQLCCFFFAFYGFMLTFLYTSSIRANSQQHSCRNWLIPSILSLFTLIVMIILVQMKLCRYWKAVGQLQRERTDSRTLTRCIQELRMKGASFDLSKEPQNAKKMKSSSVEIKWRPITWIANYFITICLLCFAGMVVPVAKFILCG